MVPHIAAAKNCILQVSDYIKHTNPNIKLRVGFCGYRDYDYKFRLQVFDVTDLHLWIVDIGVIDFSSDVPVIVGPHDVIASSLQSVVRAAAAAEKIIPASRVQREVTPSAASPRDINQSAMTAESQLPSTGTVILEVEQGGMAVPSFLGKTVRGAIEAAEESGLELDAVGSRATATNLSTRLSPRER